jgi:hypothetical protein
MQVEWICKFSQTDVLGFEWAEGENVKQHGGRLKSVYCIFNFLFDDDR